jgi:hypothetical protein
VLCVRGLTPASRDCAHAITNPERTAVRPYDSALRREPGIKREHAHETSAFFRPVIEKDAAMAFIAGATRDTFCAIVHRERITPLEFVGLLLGDNLSEQTVPWAFPDAGIARDRTHPMTITRMRAPNFTERIWSARLLRLHSCCVHPFTRSSTHAACRLPSMPPAVVIST